MSTSISLGTSADLETLTSEGNSNILDPKSDQAREKKISASNKQYERRAEAAYSMNPKVPSPSIGFDGKRQLYSFESLRYPGRFREGLYEEIDDRISKNSLEYPEQQAKNVNEWLTSATINPNSEIIPTDYDYGDDDDLSHLGRVIGVRGFSSNRTREESDHRQRARFNRLKFDYLKLKTDHDKLRANLNEILSKSKRILKKKDYDIEVLKTLVAKQGRNSIGDNTRKRLECKCDLQLNKDSLVAQNEGAESELNRLRHNFQDNQVKLNSKHREYEQNLDLLRDENKRLKDELVSKQKEYSKQVETLSNRIKVLTNEPSNRAISEIINENSRLRDLTEVDINEFLILKENYLNMEDRLKSLLEDQKCLDIEKNEEISKLMLELYRLQVHQPKLEMMVETERKIKQELQSKIDSLVETNKRLQEQLNDQLQRLNHEHMKSFRDECVEIDKLQKELSRWQDKYEKVLKEKNESEESVRKFKFKLNSFDAKHQMELDQVREVSRCENEITTLNLLQCEKERDKLSSNLESLKKKLKDTENSKEQLSNNILELHKEIEYLKVGQDIVERSKLELETSNNHLVSLEEKLSKAECKIKYLLDEQNSFKMKLEKSKRQIEELQQRIQHQQRAFDNLKESKDKELSKLRVNLNFEQYNRQVALKGIEKELRVSLKELEAMKYRFSRRLAQSDPVHSGEKIEKTNRFCNNYNGSSIHTTESLSQTTSMGTMKQNDDGGDEENCMDRGAKAKIVIAASDVTISDKFQGDTS